MTISDEVIEAAAKKIAKEFDSDEGEMWDCFAIQFKSAARAAIEAAVEAEREACEQTARIFAKEDSIIDVGSGPEFGSGQIYQAEVIAAAIRNRKSGAREGE